jgi:hypothetical protein
VLFALYYPILKKIRGFRNSHFQSGEAEKKHTSAHFTLV